MRTATLAAFVVATVLAAGSAIAQFPSAATQSTPYGQVGDAAYPPPPGNPPAGTHYEWVFNYDRHGNYLGHWETVRNH